jgi:hypothetical protein
VTGGGNVSSSDKVFTCPTKCYGVYAPGSSVTLTAKANSGSTFAGWGGACAGNAATCTVAMNAESTVTASFVAAPAAGGGGGGGAGGGAAGATSYTLSIGKTNTGSVSSLPSGVDCGASCSAKFPAGTSVSLVATPPAGKPFVSWSGACSGVDPAGCTVTMNADTKVQATFSK